MNEDPIFNEYSNSVKNAHNSKLMLSQMPDFVKRKLSIPISKLHEIILKIFLNYCVAKAEFVLP